MLTFILSTTLPAVGKVFPITITKCVTDTMAFNSLFLFCYPEMHQERALATVRLSVSESLIYSSTRATDQVVGTQDTSGGAWCKLCRFHKRGLPLSPPV